MTATAAATDTGPPEVDADGVEAPPPEPPCADERAPALPRSPATWPSTPPDGAELDVPFAEAVAVPFVVLEPVAVNDAAPPTVSARLLVAVTASVASPTTTAAPTAAEPPAAEASTVVVTPAVWVAATVSEPPSVVGPPVPIEASVVTAESETATPGAIATPPPDAPVCAVVVIESVPFALSVTVVRAQRRAVGDRRLGRIGDEAQRDRRAHARAGRARRRLRGTRSCSRSPSGSRPRPVRRPCRRPARGSRGSRS